MNTVSQFCNIKLYYKTSETKWYGTGIKNKHIVQWNRRGPRNKSKHTVSSFLRRAPKSLNRERTRGTLAGRSQSEVSQAEV
jgi:hypothetical protein